MMPWRRDEDDAFAIGECWRTRGGWKAIVIWVGGPASGRTVYAVHKPDEGFPVESRPTRHYPDGGAFAVAVEDTVAPAYDGHPADLMRPWDMA